MPETLTEVDILWGILRLSLHSTNIWKY